MELSASDCVIVCVFKLDERDSRRQEGPFVEKPRGSSGMSWRRGGREGVRNEICVCVSLNREAEWDGRIDKGAKRLREGC